MTMVDTSDSRFPKAVALAEAAAQWLKLRMRDGRKAYGIKSSRGDRYYVVTRSSCQCEDARRHPGHPCKHRVAVEIVCARAAGKPMPASDTIDGLERMVADRHPVLTMVRHEDGELSWERRQAVAANARRYDEIIGRL